MTGTVRLDTRELDRLLMSVPNKRDQIIRSAAFQIEAKAKENIRAWPLIDTGALLNSIMVERIKKGVYQIGDFGGYRGGRKSKFGKRRITTGVEYGVYWELGHRNLFTRHYMHMPFLQPAVYSVEREITKMFAEGLFK